MQQTLRNLKDVPGVIGSFIVNSEGALVDKEMPAFVGAEIYPDLGRRLATAFGTLEATVGQFDDLLLKFDEQWIYSRRLVNGVLSVLSTANINLPALRMATNIAATRVDPMIPQATLAPAPVAVAPTAPASVVTPVVPPAAKPAPAASPRRFWRGQPVD